MFKIEPGSANPWNHKKLEDFLFFNCPECHFKSQNGDDFLIHCHDHPLATDFVQSVEFDVDQNISSEINTAIHETSQHHTDHEIIIPGVDPLTFVDVNYGDEQNYDFKPAAKCSSKQNINSATNYKLPKNSSNQNFKPPKIPSYLNSPSISRISQAEQCQFEPTFTYDPSSNWEKDVFITWQEFKQYIGRENDYTSQNFMDFLSYKYHNSENSLSTVYLNLKGRLIVAYKKETGRVFQSDFPDVVEHCKALFAKPNHRKAYQKKLTREWRNFVEFAGKELNFTEIDVQNYLIKLKNERKFSQSSCKLSLASIIKGYKEDTGGVCLKRKYPELTNFCKKLYDEQ